MKQKLKLTCAALLFFFNSYSQLSSNGVHFDGYYDVVTSFATYTLGTSDITFEAWIRSDRPHDPYTPEIIFANTDMSNSGFYVYLINGQIGTIYEGPLSQQSQAPLGPDLRDSTCHHIAVTRIADNVIVYVDGVNVGSEFSPGGVANIAYNMQVEIGASLVFPGTYQFMGLLKEIRLWNVARTQSQIQANMNVVLNPASNPNLIGYYRCNEGHGQVMHNIALPNSDGYFGWDVSTQTIDPVWEQACPTCNPPPATITANGSTTFCSGGSVQLKAPYGLKYKYQWKKNGVDITGATSKNYVATTSGNYKVAVTDSITSCSRTTSSPTVVTVYQKPTATITPQGPTTFCNGDSVVLKGNYISGATYQWKKGGNLIAGATNKNYIAKTAGNYRLTITNTNGCSFTSTLVSVSVPCRTNDSNIITDSDEIAESKIYPNPSYDKFMIEVPNPKGTDIKISVFDVTGKSIQTNLAILNDNEDVDLFELSNLNPGIYFVSINNGKNNTYRKIIMASIK